jgi:hypothetical protein
MGTEHDGSKVERLARTPDIYGNAWGDDNERLSHGRQEVRCGALFAIVAARGSVFLYDCSHDQDTDRTPSWRDNSAYRRLPRDISAYPTVQIAPRIGVPESDR